MTFPNVVALALLPVATFWLLPLVAEGVTLASARRRARESGPGSPRAGMNEKGMNGDGSAPNGPAAAAAPGQSVTRLAYLVPAHDEELLIRDCVGSLCSQHAEGVEYSVFVIADNCSDGTAALAREAGATVLERQDPARPGKPAAIDWALAVIPLATFDAVVIIDADAEVDAGFAQALAERAPLRDKAVQAYNGLSNEGESWLSRLGGLLGRIRYEGQYPLKLRAGLNCPLTGNGMVLGTGVLERAGWAPDSLTENWELYARYTTAGERIDFAPKAWVGAREAKTLAHSAPQRRRWQAGRWGVFKEQWRRILASREIGVHQKLDLLAELSIPGPMLHAALAGAAAVFLLLAPGAATDLVASLFILSLVPISVWTLIAWARHPDPKGLAAAFARLPVYAVWRVVIALLSFATGRRRIWLRSPRHSPDPV